MSEEPVPRDAATLILVDRSDGPPKILVGQRRHDQVFMPGKYVFPGGRVDPGDADVPVSLALRDHEIEKLLLDMKGEASRTRARGLAVAAVRETFEETGLALGAAIPDASSHASTGTPSDTSAVREPPSTAHDAIWQAFFALGVAPRLDALTYFARAITPPGRPRRYDTRFFCAETDAISHRTDMRDEELLGLHWLTFEETRNFDLPAITRVVLEDLYDQLEAPRDDFASQPVPYYHQRDGNFRRDLLSPT
ncbi:MAG: NUDIX hydrolase [Pseudomonadota bacterium]